MNLDINVSTESILDKPLVLSWQTEQDRRIVKASVTSVATVNYTNFKSGQNETKNNVSIFDIDCIYRNINGINNDIFEEIETNHNIIKRYFFGVCKKDFIKDELRPIEGE